MSCYSQLSTLKGQKADVAAVYFDVIAPYAVYERKNHVPHSSVTKLIQNLTAGQLGNIMENQTIYTTQSTLSDMDKGMAEVFRMNIVNGDDHREPPQKSRLEPLDDKYIVPNFGSSKVTCAPGVDMDQVSPMYKKIHRLYLMAAFAVVSGKMKELADKGHSIGSILVLKGGTIAGWSTNTNQQNKSQHAEVNLLQSYFSRNNSAKSLPVGTTIYSTLKPCKMCAGMIVSCAAGGNYRVIYGQADNGQDAWKTALDKAGTSELVGSAISGQLHLVKANFITKAMDGGGTAKQAANQNKNEIEKIDLPAALAKGYEKHQASKKGGITGYLDDWGASGAGMIGAVADRLASKIGKGKSYYDQKYGPDSALLAAIRHIEAFLKDIGVFEEMIW